MILAVDDEESILFFYKQLLLAKNYCVMTACSGESGLQMFNNFHNEIDLVITDICMPNFNGIDFIQAIRNVDSTVPIVVATASGFLQCENELNEKKLQIQGLLLKPFGSEQFLTVVNDVIEVNRKNKVHF